MTIAPDWTSLPEIGPAFERRRAFVQAARESRRARRLRVLLPAFGVVLFLGVVLASVITRIEIGLSIGDLKITSDGLAMDAPRMSGSDGKGRTYLVTAESAIQSLVDTRIIRLGGIKAHVTQADGSFSDFAADSGVYDSGGQKLTLDRNITIHGSDGTAAALQTAVMDLATGAVQSSAPVAFSSNMGKIEAKGMDVTRKGKSVTFGGGVKMTVDPRAAKSGLPNGNSPATERPNP